MSLRISGKQMEIGDAFRTRISERVEEAVGKYFDGGFSGHATVEKSGSRFSADCMLRLDTGMSLQATGQAQDPQLAFDAAADRLEKRLRRYKRRLKAHPVGASGEPEGSLDDTIEHLIFKPVAGEEEEVAEDYAPAVVAELSLRLRTMSVASAVIELDTKEAPVFVFRNAGNEHVNIVYRRSDGNIGWIDPTSAAIARQNS